MEQGKKLSNLRAQLQETSNFSDIQTAISEMMSNKAFQAKSSVYNNHVYKLSHLYVSGDIDFAQVFCLMQGGYLVEINDLAEFNFVMTFVRTHYSSYVWVGTRYDENTKTWRYMATGGVMTVLSSIAGSQDASPAGETCLCLSGSSNLEDEKCNVSDRQFLCEIPA